MGARMQLEKQLQKAIVDFLNIEYRGRGRFFIIDVKGRPAYNGQGGIKWLKNPNMKGISDIHGIVDGVAIWIEVKLPREEGGGHPSRDQKAFIELVAGACGIAFVARSITEAHAKLAEALEQHFLNIKAWKGW